MIVLTQRHRLLHFFSVSMRTYDAFLFMLGMLMLLARARVLAGALKHAVTKWLRQRSRGATISMVVIACLVAALLCSFALRKRTVPLKELDAHRSSVWP